MVKACVDAYGGLDCAYNNAGMDGSLMTSIVDYKKESWDQVLAVNLTGMFLCMKYEIPEMLKRGEDRSSTCRPWPGTRPARGWAPPTS